MFSYQVMSKEEALQEKFQLLKEGEYDAIVSASEDKISSSGNPMMDMWLQVMTDEGKWVDVRDFLVFTKPMMWKIVNFSESAGLLKEYESQKLCSKVANGNRVRVQIGIEEGKEIPEDKLHGKPSGSRYPSKNKVLDYIVLDTKSEKNVLLDDDLTF